jgi:predicted transcriptional regulator
MSSDSIIDKNQSKNNQETQEEMLLRFLADKWCRKILAATLDKPKSTIELSAEIRIPISTAYRKLSDLHQAGLLNLSSKIDSDGKEHFSYKSKYKKFNAFFSFGSLEIQLTPNKN